MEFNAEKFKSIKERVKKEVYRRDDRGSVDQYADKRYDYIEIPRAGGFVKTEHYNKIAEPMRAINPDGIEPPVSPGDFLVSTTHINIIDSKLTILESKSMETTSTGCAGSCTGLCFGSCGGNCDTGCYSNCAVDCNDSCYTNCYTNCKDSCYNSNNGW